MDARCATEGAPQVRARRVGAEHGHNPDSDCVRARQFLWYGLSSPLEIFNGAQRGRGARNRTGRSADTMASSEIQQELLLMVKRTRLCLRRPPVHRQRARAQPSAMAPIHQLCLYERTKTQATDYAATTACAGLGRRSPSSGPSSGSLLVVAAVTSSMSSLRRCVSTAFRRVASTDQIGDRERSSRSRPDV